ncbi:MAG: glycosyltransferase family 4 protein [Ignavibacteriae bacterium]|nr:glycosyltransferase family 4 protein [Ignavibacteriota bacterium]
MIKNNIRLLHFVKDLEIGGIEKSTILYSNILVEKLEFVGIYAKKGFYDNSDLITEKVKRYFPKYSIWNKLFFLTNLEGIIRIIRNTNITHIHYHHRIFIPFIFFIKLIFPKIKIIYSHQNVFKDLINSFILGDKIIALTEATKNDLPKSLKKKTTVIPHGTILSTQIKQNRKPTTFGYVGRFVEWKEVRTLVYEFSTLNKKNKKTKLVLVGTGPLKKKLLDDVKNLYLEKSIVFIEPQKDLTNIYKMIDVLVLPSKLLEGFGIVLVEAMSYGIPVIVCDIPTYSDTVIDNYNGIIIKNSISEAMQKLTESVVLYSKLSKNAKQHSLNYDINIIVERYLSEIYS